MSPEVPTRIAMATSSKGRSDFPQWRRRANFGSAYGAPASNLRFHIFGCATRHVQRPRCEGSGQSAAVVAAVDRATCCPLDLFEELHFLRVSKQGTESNERPKQREVLPASWTPARQLVSLISNNKPRDV
jgi:hypothetical protein